MLGMSCASLKTGTRKFNGYMLETYDTWGLQCKRFISGNITMALGGDPYLFSITARINSTTQTWKS